MNFRSLDDLSRLVRRNLYRIPCDIDVVVGIPRSGMVPAALIALHRNTALSDLDGLIEGRPLALGAQRLKSRIVPPSDWRRILLVDDSIQSGASMRGALSRLNDIGRWQIISCAVFATPQSASLVDLTLDNCPPPRLFEWNMMHHPLLRMACVDLDGVLCLDPLNEENDDGARYREFLAGARAHMLPTLPVGAIVSSRLEKYREPTERWLRAHGVVYGELHLLDLPSASARRRSKCHAQFKASVFKSRTDWRLFIESDPEQAVEIAARSGKAVVCTETMQHFPETAAARLERGVTRRLAALLGHDAAPSDPVQR